MHRIMPLILMTALLTGRLCALAAEKDPEPRERFLAHVPIQALTQGPKAHWFGYYDKFCTDKADRYVLAAEVDFEDHTPSPEDTIRLGYIDTENDCAWTPFAETQAWGWQQGCMLQWIPGSDQEVIYNIREGNIFKSVVENPFTGEKRLLPRAIYTLSPDGQWALCANFARIQDTRPGYGYHGGVDPNADVTCPADEGIFLMNLKTGDSKLVVSLGEIAKIPMEQTPPGNHWFNHLLFNTDGSRFIFLHRAHLKAGNDGSWTTRMFTADRDGGNLHVVADHGMVSHFIWKNPQQILAWSREPETGNRFHLYTDQTDEIKVIAGDLIKQDGHCTYSPDTHWILVDTYPDREQMQHLMLYRPADGKLVQLGKFYRPKPSSGEWRCDLHPRWSRSGNFVIIDSMHLGDQRQMYRLDVSGIIGAQ